MNQQEIYSLINQHYRDNYERLVKGLSNNSGSRHNAEDVIQNAYLRACEYWTSFNAEKDFTKWFNGILNNSLRDKINEERMQGMHDDGQEVEEPQHKEISKIILKEVQEFINSQPERIAKILRLHFLFQYSIRDISKLVGNNKSEIGRLIYEFRKTMKEKFQVRLFQ